MLHCLKESYPFKWQYLISRHCEWGLDRLVFPDSALKSVDVSFHIPSPPPSVRKSTRFYQVLLRLVTLFASQISPVLKPITFL